MNIEKMRGAVLQHYEKGRVLIRQGDPVTYLYYLVSGVVHREVVTMDGSEIIPSVKTAASKGVASMVGILLLFDRQGGSVSSSSFITHTACTCYQIPKESVMEYLRERPEELIHVIEMAVEENGNTFQLLLARNEGQVANRLCKILEERCIEKDGKYIVAGQNTNIELAKFLCVHKVTVARIIRQLKAEGIISKRGGSIVVLEPELLKEYAECRRQLKYF